MTHLAPRRGRFWVFFGHVTHFHCTVISGSTQTAGGGEVGGGGVQPPIGTLIFIVWSVELHDYTFKTFSLVS